MRVTAEIHVSGYGPIVERFESLGDAVAYVRHPSDVRPIGGEWHPSSFWPCWPDREDLSGPDYAGSTIGLVFRGIAEGAEEGYPDWLIEVGPRGGLIVVTA